MKTYLLPLLLLCSPVLAEDCGDEFDPRGKQVGHQNPDFDPIYENLGPVVGYTPDNQPIYEKTGATYGHDKGKGNVTGYTFDGERLYDGEKRPRFTIDGDRITPLGEKNEKKFDIW